MGRLSDFGPLEISNYEQFLQQQKEDFTSKWMKKIEYEESLNDFELIETLGHGTFGEVVLVKNKLAERHSYHAMKIIEKKKIVEKKQIENTRTEKCILQALSHPLTIHMDFFYQDTTYLYLIMPYIPGGELFKHLKKFGRFEEDHTKFYSAQVILAIEFLHMMNFIHRDLKPENILVDHTGYLKLADFGFCKNLEGKGRTYTLCGTPEYMAPEVVSHKGYGFSADWWSVGILIYELNAGNSPFYSRSTPKVFKKILMNVYKMPGFFSTDLRDIVDNLLQDNNTKRFGNLKNGVDDIKQHKWFRSVNWLAILSRKLMPPFKPAAKHLGTRSGNKTLQTYSELRMLEVDKYKSLFEHF